MIDHLAYSYHFSALSVDAKSKQSVQLEADDVSGEILLTPLLYVFNHQNERKCHIRDLLRHDEHSTLPNEFTPINGVEQIDAQ